MRLVKSSPSLGKNPSNPQAWLLNCVPHQVERCVTPLGTAGVQFWLPVDSRRSVLRVDRLRLLALFGSVLLAATTVAQITRRHASEDSIHVRQSTSVLEV